MSQLDLALEAEISQKHLSFVESGRATPSREMVLHLAERLDVPRRERNVLLVAAGYAPLFRERSLDDEALLAARQAIGRVLKAHEPYPALAMDRHWTMVAANAALLPLMRGVEEESLTEPPVNVLRLSLHPRGLAPRIENYGEWRAHLLERLGRQISATGDPVLLDLMREISAFPAPPGIRSTSPQERNDIFVPLRLVTENGALSFLSTTTVFGTPLDVTLSEIAMECFFPADPATADTMKRLWDAERQASANAGSGAIS